jgi:metal-responsive CopG/Arc/MetJ family transcriptional regulator
MTAVARAGELARIEIHCITGQEAPVAGTRRLITISLPPPLLKQAEQVAAEENRTKSELLREALRFYVETRDVRRAATRDRVFELINKAQDRAKATPSPEIRKLIRESVAAVRSGNASRA